MPRYFFNIREGETLIEDFDGSYHLDLAAARAEALAAARDLLAERLRAGHILNGQRFEIMAEDGMLLDTVMFKEAVRLPSAGSFGHPDS